MVIVDSDGGGADVVGTPGGVSGVVGEVKDVASGVVTIEGAVVADDMIFVGISTYCACCGIFGCAGLVGALGGAT